MSEPEIALSRFRKGVAGLSDVFPTGLAGGRGGCRAAASRVHIRPARTSYGMEPGSGPRSDHPPNPGEMLRPAYLPGGFERDPPDEVGGREHGLG